MDQSKGTLAPLSHLMPVLIGRNGGWAAVLLIWLFFLSLFAVWLYAQMLPTYTSCLNSVELTTVYLQSSSTTWNVSTLRGRTMSDLSLCPGTVRLTKYLLKEWMNSVVEIYTDLWCSILHRFWLSVLKTVTFMKAGTRFTWINTGTSAEHWYIVSTDKYQFDEWMNG